MINLKFVRGKTTDKSSTTENVYADFGCVNHGRKYSNNYYSIGQLKEREW